MATLVMKKMHLIYENSVMCAEKTEQNSIIQIRLDTDHSTEICLSCSGNVAFELGYCATF